MATTGERLSVISGLAAVSAATHMKSAGASSGISAGALLLNWSSLATATAMVHLQDAGGTPPAPTEGRPTTRSPLVRVGHLL